MPHLNLEPIRTAPAMKQCYKCQQTLPIDDFKKDKRYADGYEGQCRNCCNARHRQEKIDRDIRKLYNKLKDKDNENTKDV